MPLFNARGDYLAGIGTAPILINDAPIDVGGRGGWLTEGVVVYGRCPAAGCEVVSYDRATGAITQVLNQGANVIDAGGGVWAAWNNTGLYLSTAPGRHRRVLDRVFVPERRLVQTRRGPISTEAGAGTVGPDGAVAYSPDYQVGIGADVLERDGTIWRLTDGIAYDVQLLGARRAVWQEHNEVRVAGLPLPAPAITNAYRPRVSWLNGEPWVCWWSAASGLITLRPLVAPDNLGYQLGPGDKFNHDFLALDNWLSVVWAEGQGEHVNVVDDVDPAWPRVSLAPPPPEPEPPAVQAPTATITAYAPAAGRAPLTVQAEGAPTGGDPPETIEWLARPAGAPQWAEESPWRHTYVLPAGEWEIGLRVGNTGGQDQTSPRRVSVAGEPVPPEPEPGPEPEPDDVPVYDTFVNTECPKVAASFEREIGAPPAPPNMGHNSYRRLALGWTAEEVLQGIADPTFNEDRLGWFGAAPVDYGTFVNNESGEVADAYRRTNPDPSVPTPEQMGHTAWRRLAEYWTHRDILHDIAGEPLEDGGAGGAGTPVPEVPSGFAGPLRQDGRVLRTETGARFVWRGATSFRLLHMIATGEEPQAVERLQQLAAGGFNLVRVLATARHLFDLPADLGRQYLPRLFDLALQAGVYVEIVALADTEDWSRGALEDHLTQVAARAAEWPHVLLEGGNEIGPCHETQSPESVDVARGFVPAAAHLLYCPGSVHGGGWCNEQAALTDEQWQHGCATGEWPYWDEVHTYSGDFGTSHLKRDGDDANRGRRVRELEASSGHANCLFVDDEPLGADETTQPEKRSAEPGVFYLQGVLSRIFEVGSTFHSQAGLTSAPFGPVQQQCAEAFINGTRIVADSVMLTYKNAGWHDAPIKDFTGACRIYQGVGADPIACVIAPEPGLAITYQNGWREGGVRADVTGCRVLTLVAP